MPLYVTAKPTDEWTGSIVHVPVGMPVIWVVVLIALPLSSLYNACVRNNVEDKS
jgi:hypothetical protein